MKLLPTIDKLSEIKDLEKLGVTIEFIPEEESMQPDFEDIEDIKEVERKYNTIGLCAWFSAKVTVTYKNFNWLEANDYLGGCSYNSFKEFTNEENGYYMDMINTCINELNRTIESVNFGVQRQWNIRKAKKLIAPYGLHIINSNILQTI